MSQHVSAVVKNPDLSRVREVVGLVNDLPDREELIERIRSEIEAELFDLPAEVIADAIIADSRGKL